MISAIRSFLFVNIILFLLVIPGVTQDNSNNIIREGDTDAARRVRRAELNDRIRPSWHLTIPEGVGFPFDPNGAIFKDGIYHLWYLYVDNGSAKWQHLTSIDLFHWRWQPNNLQHNPGDADAGSNSGNAFVAADGNVVMSYNGIGTTGNCVAYSDDKDLNHWVKPKANPIASPGWDPHMWYENGIYYQIAGGMPIWTGLPKRPTLFTGKSYKEPMQLVGNFMTHDLPGIDDFEDVSCPDFFKMGDKWVLVCISHQRGARYYIGDWNGKQFKPEYHHRMNWPGGTYFAPETLLDDKGRRIAWAWLLDRKSGVSSGSMAMPRVLTMAKDKKSLLFEPPKEIELLRYAPQTEKSFTVTANQPLTLKNTQGSSLELNIVIDPGKARQFGIKVFCSADGREQTPIVVDLDKKTLQIDMRKSSLDFDSIQYKEFVVMKDNEKRIETLDAPFELKKGEMLNLRVFLDKSMVEVFANGRQCMTQVVYPTLNDAIHVQLFTEDAPVVARSVQSWKLFPAMQW